VQSCVLIDLYLTCRRQALTWLMVQAVAATAYHVGYRSDDSRSFDLHIFVLLCHWHAAVQRMCSNRLWITSFNQF